MMIPTMHLRFITRDVCYGVNADGDDHWESQKVLQQAFEVEGAGREWEFELWRDVPLVTDP